MTMVISEGELHQKVLRATLQLYDNESFEALPGENALGAVVRLSGVLVGHVRTVLEAYGVEGLWSNGPKLGMTRGKLDNIRAHVEMPVAREASMTSSNTFNVSTGAHNQVQLGEHVSGTQTMTTQQLIDTIADQIRTSPLIAPEHKQSALQMLKELTSIPGVSEILKAGAGVLIEAAKHIIGG
jgi:hypothetical protein